MRTEGEILQLVFDIVKGSALYSFIKQHEGEVYKKRRPIHREGKMDVVVAVLAGTCGKFQSFTVNVNVYLSDINSNGEFFEDTALSKEVHVACIP